MTEVFFHFSEQAETLSEDNLAVLERFVILMYSKLVLQWRTGNRTTHGTDRKWSHFGFVKPDNFAWRDTSHSVYVYVLLISRSIIKATQSG